MARMVRKQIVLDPQLEREVAARAQDLGISQSEFIRRAIEAMRSPTHDSQEAAWARARNVMLQADTLRTGSGGRRWTRKEIHERPGRNRH